jgi:hypothetical protein
MSFPKTVSSLLRLFKDDNPVKFKVEHSYGKLETFSGQPSPMPYRIDYFRLTNDMDHCRGSLSWIAPRSNAPNPSKEFISLLTIVVDRTAIQRTPPNSSKLISKTKRSLRERTLDRGAIHDDTSTNQLIF